MAHRFRSGKRYVSWLLQQKRKKRQQEPVEPVPPVEPPNPE